MRVQHPEGGRVMTKQSEADACNINVMLARWLKTGVVKMVTGSRPMYGDFSNADDYHTMVNRVNAAHEEFMRLPSKVRKKADNDVGKFVELVMDEANRDELMELGLDESYFPARAPVPADEPPPVDPAPTPPVEP